MTIRPLLLGLLLCLPWAVQAQQELRYQRPSDPILQLADYERPPSVLLDSRSRHMLLLSRSPYKTLEDLSQEELRLGGLRINPRINAPSTLTFVSGLKVRQVGASADREVQGLPASPRLAYFSWSPAEDRVAFAHATPQGLELWVLDVAQARASRLTGSVLNANLGMPFSWYADGSALLVRQLPADRPALLDPARQLPTGPVVSESDGSKAQNRTYQDLLRNPMDERNFEMLATSELYRVEMDGKASRFAPKSLYSDERFSPDGRYLLVSEVQRPFSYLVPYFRFPTRTSVYDMQGSLVKVVEEQPLLEVLPKGFMATYAGKRSLQWRADEPATLAYVQALDGGDPQVQVSHRDELWVWEAPFSGPARAIAKTVNRFAGVNWGGKDLAVLYDRWYDSRNAKTYLLDPSQASQRLLFDRNYQDIYADPGNFQTVRNAYGREVLAREKGRLFLLGEGHTPKGQFPFLDALDLRTLKTSRLYQSAYADRMETLLSLQDAKKGEMLVMQQSKDRYPNYFMRQLGRKDARQLTDFPNPFASMAGVHKEVIKYKRKDGVELSGVLYLPAGYDRAKKEKLPLLIWAYPQEFKDKQSAGQSSANPQEFTFPYYGSFVYWAMKGYAVLDDAAFPIVGEGKSEPNDTFVEQLVANAEAAIEAVDALGYIDRSRVGVGGHSYGAFMTANLLTHSKLFACGIARSGAYNRTLTPFGFQGEQRNYWEASEVYDRMSPFMNADKMKTPMLLVHGEADNNPGTFTLQTERYFQALKGLGAPARMLILPKESHGYAAKESILHLLWEQERFLDKYLKPQKAQ